MYTIYTLHQFTNTVYFLPVSMGNKAHLGSQGGGEEAKRMFFLTGNPVLFIVDATSFIRTRACNHHET